MVRTVIRGIFLKAKSAEITFNFSLGARLVLRLPALSSKSLGRKRDGIGMHACATKITSTPTNPCPMWPCVKAFQENQYQSFLGVPNAPHCNQRLWRWHRFSMAAQWYALTCQQRNPQQNTVDYQTPRAAVFHGKWDSDRSTTSNHLQQVSAIPILFPGLCSSFIDVVLTAINFFIKL